MTVAKALPTDLIDSLLSGYKKLEDLIGGSGLLKQLTKTLVERALAAEMEADLGHAKKNEAITNPAGNARNCKSSKTLKGDFGELPIEIPVTVTAASNRSSSPRTRRAGMASPRRSCRCMSVA